MDLREKRRYSRVKLKSPLHFNIRGRGDFSDTVSEDISAGGICFTNNQYIAPLTNLMLELKLLSRVLNAIGRVVWVNPLAHSDRYRMGVEFVELDPQKKLYLSEYILMQENIL
ncbi:MAG: PilZ domain-containing protein [Candidatus Omnitrophica bacterium]|nr:PilZ domain-containing protein [Candidatus Omnitrophota bacterium]